MEVHDVDPELEERLVTLEMRVAFQDDTINQLNAVITEMHEKLAVLSIRVRELSAQATPTLVSKDDDATPPHY